MQVANNRNMKSWSTSVFWAGTCVARTPSRNCRLDGVVATRSHEDAVDEKQTPSPHGRRRRSIWPKRAQLLGLFGARRGQHVLHEHADAHGLQGFDLSWE